LIANPIPRSNFIDAGVEVDAQGLSLKLDPAALERELNVWQRIGEGERGRATGPFQHDRYVRPPERVMIRTGLSAGSGASPSENVLAPNAKRLSQPDKQVP
jgi:hypothetical protein